MKQLKIGDVIIKNRLLLAPMVDVSDLPYRLICRKAGATMAYTEMVYLDAITHENEKTKKMMETNHKDSPIGIQITGNNVGELKKAISMKVFEKYDIVDINCGCPSVRITGNEAGSYLLKKPEKIASMIRLLKNEGYTATAKIRLGYENNNVIKISKMIEKAGADALTVHPRLAIQSMKTPADWKEIEKVKREIGIPVIGNGDITSGESASRMLEIADGAMIARAALGDPGIFSRIQHYLKTGKEKEFDVKKNLKYFNVYLKMCKRYKFEEMHRIKYIGGNFIRKFEGAAKARAEFMKLKDLEEIGEFAKKLI